MDSYSEHVETNQTPLHHPGMEGSWVAAIDFVQEAYPLIRGRKEGARATGEVSDARFAESH
jgi:hypothetical protein